MRTMTPAFPPLLAGPGGAHLTAPAASPAGDAAALGTFVTADLVAHYDASHPDGFDVASNTVRNLVGDPAYDMTLLGNAGISGKPGDLARGFCLAENGLLAIKAAANPPLLASLQNTGAEWTIEFWGVPPAHLGWPDVPFTQLWTTYYSPVAPVPGTIGMTLHDYYINQNASGGGGNPVVWAVSWATTHRSMRMISINWKQGSPSWCWQNDARLVSTAGATEFTPSFSGTTPASHRFHFGRFGVHSAVGGLGMVVSIVRIYAKQKTDAEMTANWNGQRARFGL